MHKSVVLLAALAASGLIAETAWAKTISIKFVSEKELATACKAQPGAVSYSQNGGTYGCIGRNIVECNSNTKTCQGHIKRGMPGSQDALGVLGIVAAPGKPSKPGGVLGSTGILEGGTVLGAQGPAATGSPAGGGRPAAAPSAPPVIIR